MMQQQVSLLCAAAILLLATVAAVSSSPSVNETAARLWFDNFDKEFAQEQNLLVEASWNNAVNITADNQKAAVAAQLRFAKFRKDSYTDMAGRFAWKNFTDKSLVRKFDKAADIGTAVANENMQTILGNLQNELDAVYSTATVKDPTPGGQGRQLPLDPDITNMLADVSVSESVKRQLWVGWRDASGRKMKQNYTDFVSTMNTMIREAGAKNMAEYWQSSYEPKANQNFEKMMRDLWNEVKPFYEQLHAFVRHKLMAKYGAEIFPPTGHIPAHLLGNMWAQSWLSTEKITTPFPDLNNVDITEAMQQQNWNATHMFRVSEEFFASIGFDNMTDTFWQKSVIEKLQGVQMVCHASAWDFYTGKGDFRIKQCTSITLPYLATTHHEMGHIQYFQEYEKQPVVYRDGANPGFHEAVGDTLELSVMTPEHLVKIGLLNNTIDDKEYYLNYLFQMALTKVAFIPFGYLIDQWRWKVFDGTVKSQEYNEYWWKQRCEVQGVSSPVKRSSDDFDAGAKYHVPGNTPYIRYFVSHILQFQLYEALCKAANHTGPLYKCDFYRNKAAGNIMRTMLQKGSSEHWEEILFAAIGTRTMSAEPLKRYFKELTDFLAKENSKNNVTVGWNSACPDDSWYDGTTTAPPPMPTTTRSGVAVSSSVGFVAAAGVALPLAARRLAALF